MGDMPATCSQRNGSSAITLSDAASDSADEAAAGPPSPVATVIVDVQTPPPVYYPPIKVRDFAYPAVWALPTAHISTSIMHSAFASSLSCSSDISTPSQPSPSYLTFIESVPTPSTLNPSPAYEVFDQNFALAIVDREFSNMCRTVPIPGRTLRRLLDIGWITEEELKTYAKQIDLDALAQHDSRPQYPWRPVYPGAFWDNPSGPTTGTDNTPSYTTLVPYEMYKAVGPPPPREVRNAALLGSSLGSKDRRAAHMNGLPVERTADLLMTVSAFISQSQTGDCPHSVRIPIGSRDPHATNRTAIVANSGTGNKRCMGEDYEEDNEEMELLPEISRVETKKRRTALGESSSRPSVDYWARLYASSSQPAAGMHLPKQYPAPLYAYDPKIYPEAARLAATATEDASRSPHTRKRLGMGRLQHVVKPKSTALMHEADAEEDDVDTDPDSEDEGHAHASQLKRVETLGAIGHPTEPKEVGCSSPRPTLIRRTLGRTRTVAQLCVSPVP